MSYRRFLQFVNGPMSEAMDAEDCLDPEERESFRIHQERYIARQRKPKPSRQLKLKRASELTSKS